MQFNTREAIIQVQRGGKLADVYKSLMYLRTRTESEEQVQALSQLDVGEIPFAGYLTGICFPQTWKEIWNLNVGPRIENAQRAINWFVSVAQHYAARIREHSIIRSELHRKLLAGNW